MVTTRALAIDIGSNAVRAEVAELSPDGKLIVLEQFREPVRLGKDVFDNGEIPTGIKKRLIDAIQFFVKSGKDFGVTMIRAVATSAMREARNADEVLAGILHDTKVAVEIIPGTEEARLVSDAVKATVDISKKRVVLIDIGGGSTEISLLDDGDVVLSESIRIGAVRLLRVNPNRLTRMVEQYAGPFLERIVEQLQGEKPLDMVLGCGGNCESLLTIFHREKEKKVESAAMEKLLVAMRPLTVEDRMKQYGLRPDRADTIIPALEVLTKILKELQASELYVPGVGLREGILLELLQGQGRHPNRSVRQLERFAENILRRFRGDVRHARVVMQHALKIYDALPGTKSTDEDRLFLRLAAILHDIGQAISPEGHHKHTYYILTQTPFVGLDLLEREVIAQIARYHRKAPPSLKHEPFKKLSPENQDRVTRLASILKIAEALDQAHLPGTLSIEVACSATELIITASGDDDGFERWRAKKVASLFESTYNRQVEIR